MTIEARDFFIVQLMDEVLRMHEEAARAKGLELMVEVGEDVPLELCGDALRLRQILLNFVGNAIKFSTHGCVRIKVDVAERRRP
jgi:two-component system sensor histidine kinase/response regulator